MAICELAHILALEKKLSEKGLYLKLIDSSISRIDLTGDEPLIYVSCPRVPADLEAKIGYKRANYNPNKKVAVFGYQAMITTNIELEIGLELPIGCVSSPADELDGSYLIAERKNLSNNMDFCPILALVTVALISRRTLVTSEAPVPFLLLTTISGMKRLISKV